MTLSIPRDPTAVAAARIAAGLIVLLIVLAAWPRQDTPLAPVVRAQAPQPITLIATPTPRSVPEPPAPVVVAQDAAPTAEAPAPIASMPAAESQLVHNSDGSVSLPGSEAWMQPQTSAAQTADPIEQAAAEAYKQLPAAAPPSAENNAPNHARRPYTGR